MKIASYIDTDEAVADFHEKGRICLYEKGKGGWLKTKEVPFEMHPDLSLSEIKAGLRQAVAQLEDCKVFVVRQVRGLMNAVLQEELGFRTWQSQGPLPEQLDSVARHDQAFVAEQAAKRATGHTANVSAGRAGCGEGCSLRPTDRVIRLSQTNHRLTQEIVMPESTDPHPHGPMRRKEREITDHSEIEEIIRSEKVMHVALVDGELPFLVPVFYAFDGTALYFHSAQAGRKIEILKRNHNVCFAISVDQGFIENDEACDFEARHRTVIGAGRAVFVEETAEKIKALDLIVARFSPKKFEYPKANLDRTAVIRIDIDSIKGKKHGF